MRRVQLRGVDPAGFSGLRARRWRLDKLDAVAFFIQPEMLQNQHPSKPRAGAADADSHSLPTQILRLVDSRPDHHASLREAGVTEGEQRLVSTSAPAPRMMADTIDRDRIP